MSLRAPLNTNLHIPRFCFTSHLHTPQYSPQNPATSQSLTNASPNLARTGHCRQRPGAPRRRPNRLDPRKTIPPRLDRRLHGRETAPRAPTLDPRSTSTTASPSPPGSSTTSASSSARAPTSSTSSASTTTATARITPSSSSSRTGRRVTTRA